MAPVQPAYVLQGRSDHPASLLRLTLAGLTPGAVDQGDTTVVGGVSPFFGNRLAVTGQSSLNVSVDTGLVYMPGKTAWQGVYAGYNTAPYTVPIPASSSTQWRQDWIVARQHDTQYGDPDNNWDIVDVPGLFSSSAPGVLPSLGGLNAVPLAIVSVTPNMSFTNNAVVDARQYGNLPGPLFTTSGNKPPLTAPEGTMWWEQDTNLMGVIVNNSYEYLLTVAQGLDPWRSLAPLSFSNGWHLADDLPVSGYRKAPYDPNTMEFMASLDMTSVPGGANDGSTILTMPAGYRVNSNYHRIPMMFTTNGTIAPIPTAPFIRFASDGTVSCFGLTGLELGGELPETVFVNGSVRLA